MFRCCLLPRWSRKPRLAPLLLPRRLLLQTPQQGGEWLAAIGLAAVVAGFAVGTPVIRLLEARFGARTPVMVLAWLLFGCVPLSVAIGFATSPVVLYGAFAVQLTLVMGMNMVTPTMLQRMSPQHVRARIFAMVTIFTLIAQSSR